MSILQVINGHKRDLGGFVVRRILPAADRQMVGPFIFFDHLGPADFAAGTGIDVRPHPHIGLATVTYLFAGSLEHRDSLGTVREIRPGDVNWMTAGSGIVHSERTPQVARAAGPHVHGIQSWVALPDGSESIDATFAHHPAESLPQATMDGVELTLIAGDGFGMRSPVATLWRTLYADVQMRGGASLEVPAEPEEIGIYVVQGTIEVNGMPVHAGSMALLESAPRRVQARGDARAMLLGGARFPTPRYMFWNFVASSRERIDAAKDRWKAQQFPQVPNETEFIPLPT